MSIIFLFLCLVCLFLSFYGSNQYDWRDSSWLLTSWQDSHAVGQISPFCRICMKKELEFQRRETLVLVHQHDRRDFSWKPAIKSKNMKSFVPDLQLKCTHSHQWLEIKQFYTSNNWSYGIITALHKSGNKDDPWNYRGICISSCLGKLFCSILNTTTRLYELQYCKSFKTELQFNTPHTNDNTMQWLHW